MRKRAYAFLQFCTQWCAEKYVESTGKSKTVIFVSTTEVYPFNVMQLSVGNGISAFVNVLKHCLE